MHATEYMYIHDDPYAGHVHRQNCLKEFGVNFALQKLEKEERKRLRSR